MTGNDFRRLALAYPEAVETVDDGVSHFRVRGKVFARLAAHDPRWAEVMLSRKDWQAATGEPELMARMPGGWFRHGYTQINISKLGHSGIKGALDAAFAFAAPKGLAAWLSNTGRA